MTVVFGTTLQPDSGPYAEVAARLAVKLETTLRLIHVCEDPRAPLVLGTDQEKLLGSIRADLADQAEELRRRTAATVRPHLASGPVLNALASLAELELATALIVGGTSHQIGDPLGRLSRMSRVPVIALREPDRLLAWLRGERPLRVLVGADLGRASEGARAFAGQLADLGPAQVEVAFVASPRETHARLGLARPNDGELSPEAESALLRELSLIAPASERSTQLRVISGRGRADAHLVARADEEGFDLIVVGQRHQSIVEQLWRGSVTSGVLETAPVSVATVPLPPDEPDVTFRPPQVVVVSIDLTDIGQRAVAHAIDYAAAGATVHVAHVLPPIGLPSDVRQTREEALHQLSKVERNAGAGRSVTIQTHILKGIPAEQLLSLCERVSADLLVVGVRKRTSLGRAITGSTTWTIIDRARVPVLLVPAREL